MIDLMKISAYRADYLPLFGQLMNQKLPQIINEAVTKPNSQAKVDASTMIDGMNLSLLSDCKIKLCRLYYKVRNKDSIRSVEIENVERLRKCKTSRNGYKTYQCPKCGLKK